MSSEAKDIDDIQLSETNYNAILYEICKQFGPKTLYIEDAAPALVWTNTSRRWVAACAAPYAPFHELVYFLLPGSWLCRKIMCRTSTDLWIGSSKDIAHTLIPTRTKDIAITPQCYIQDLVNNSTKAIMYYGASAQAAAEIRKNGFRSALETDAIGKGVYLSRDLQQATKNIDEHGEILRCEVNLGRVILLKKACWAKAMKFTMLGNDGAAPWWQTAYDAAWHPPLGYCEDRCDLPMYSSNSMICVWDPLRIQIAESKTSSESL